MDRFFELLRAGDLAHLGSGTLVSLRIVLIIVAAWIAIAVLQRANSCAGSSTRWTRAASRFRSRT